MRCSATLDKEYDSTLREIAMQRKWVATVVAGSMLLATTVSAFAQGDAPPPAALTPGGAAGSGAAGISADAVLLGVGALALAGGLALALSGNGHGTTTTTTTGTQ